MEETTSKQKIQEVHMIRRETIVGETAYDTKSLD